MFNGKSNRLKAHGLLELDNSLSFFLTFLISREQTIAEHKVTH